MSDKLIKILKKIWKVITAIITIACFAILCDIVVSIVIIVMGHNVNLLTFIVIFIMEFFIGASFALDTYLDEL